MVPNPLNKNKFKTKVVFTYLKILISECYCKVYPLLDTGVYSINITL